MNPIPDPLLMGMLKERLGHSTRQWRIQRLRELHPSEVDYSLFGDAQLLQAVFEAEIPHQSVYKCVACASAIPFRYVRYIGWLPPSGWVLCEKCYQAREHTHFSFHYPNSELFKVSGDLEAVTCGECLQTVQWDVELLELRVMDRENRARGTRLHALRKENQGKELKMGLERWKELEEMSTEAFCAYHRQLEGKVKLDNAVQAYLDYSKEYETYVPGRDKEHDANAPWRWSLIERVVILERRIGLLSKVDFRCRGCGKEVISKRKPQEDIALDLVNGHRLCMTCATSLFATEKVRHAVSVLIDRALEDGLFKEPTK